MADPRGPNQHLFDVWGNGSLEVGSDLPKATCPWWPEPFQNSDFFLPSPPPTASPPDPVLRANARAACLTEAGLTLEVVDLEEILTLTHILRDPAWGLVQASGGRGLGSCWGLGSVLSREHRSRIAAWLLKQHNIIKSVMEPRP